jgi:hypothetical protein
MNVSASSGLCHGLVRIVPHTRKPGNHHHNGRAWWLQGDPPALGAVLTTPTSRGSSGPSPANSQKMSPFTSHFGVNTNRPTSSVRRICWAWAGCGGGLPLQQALPVGEPVPEVPAHLLPIELALSFAKTSSQSAFRGVDT